MTNNPSGSAALILWLLVFLTVPALAQSPADLVMRGGDVYTVDAVRSWAQAIAVADGKIVYVGTDAGVSAWIGSQTSHYPRLRSRRSPERSESDRANGIVQARVPARSAP